MCIRDSIGSDLTGADFRGSLIVGVSFRDTNLTKANFQDAVLLDVVTLGATFCQTAMELGDINDSGC